MKHYSIVFSENHSYLCVLDEYEDLIEFSCECNIRDSTQFFENAKDILHTLSENCKNEIENKEIGNLVIVVPPYVSISDGFPNSMENICNEAKTIFNASATVVIDEIEATSKRVLDDPRYQGEIMVISALENGLFYRRYMRKGSSLSEMPVEKRIHRGTLHHTDLYRAIRQHISEDKLAANILNYILTCRDKVLSDTLPDDCGKTDKNDIERIFNSFAPEKAPWPSTQTCSYILLTGPLADFCLLRRLLARVYGRDPGAKDCNNFDRIIQYPRVCRDKDNRIMTRYYSAMWAKSDEAFPVIGTYVSVHLLDAQGKDEKITLAAEDETKKSLQEVKHVVNNVYAKKTDKVTVETAGGTTYVPVEELFDKDEAQRISIGIRFSEEDNSLHLCLESGTHKTDQRIN